VLVARCINMLSTIVSFVVKAARAIMLKYRPAKATSLRLVLKDQDLCNCSMVAPLSACRHHAIAMPLPAVVVSQCHTIHAGKKILTNGHTKADVCGAVEAGDDDVGCQLLRPLMLRFAI